MRYAALILAFFLTSVVSAQDTPIMPLSEVRPGMQGYGLTVFQGTEREQFTFRVRSIVPNLRGWPYVIVGELTGCPNCSEGGVHMFEHHQIYGGMSGSPMRVADPVTGAMVTIGGLAMAKDFATTSKVLITPWEYQEGMASKLAADPTSHSVAEPGDYASTCLVYGDRDWCFDGTVTGRKGGYLFLMSHSLPWTEDTDFTYGETALPVFRVPVADLLQSQQSATKLTGERLEPLGSAVIHGKFGFVVREGDLSATAPVTLTIEGVSAEPIILQFHMAYDRHAPWALNALLGEAIRQLPDFPSNRTVVNITLNNPKGAIRIADMSGTALGSMRSILEKLISQEKKELNIAGIDIQFTPSSNDELWRPIRVWTSNKGENAKLTLLARRLKDNQVAQITENVDARPLKTCGKLKLYWWDGPSAQNAILVRMPVRDALGLLEQIQEREALYLMYTPGDDDLKANDEGSSNGSWKKRDSGVRLLIRPTLNHNRFYLPPDDKRQVRVIENNAK